MNDLISRQAVEELIMETDPWWSEGMTRAILEGIKKLPAIDVPDRKVGEWEFEPGAKYCSRCGWMFSYEAGLDEDWDYCPNCGAKMEE